MKRSKNDAHVFTQADFDLLLKTNKSFKKAWNEINYLFNGTTVSQNLLNEIEQELKRIINEKK